MFTPLHHIPGSRALCVIQSPGSANETAAHACEVVELVSADDRDYRINVRLDDGRVLGPCAPECVIPINS